MHPSKELLNSKPPAIIERDPLRFWQIRLHSIRAIIFTEYCMAIYLKERIKPCLKLKVHR